MLKEKKEFILKELPQIEDSLGSLKRDISKLISQEKELSQNLKKAGALEELELILLEFNRYYENKGNLEEQKRLWEKSIENIEG